MYKSIETIRTENLAFLVNKFGMDELAARLERSSAQIRNWISNNKDHKTKQPLFIGSKSCRRVEEALELPKCWMDHDHSAPVKKEGYVPVVSWVAAGRWTGMDDQSVEPIEWLACPLTHSNRSYALVVRGVSMDNPEGRPSFQEGDIIYVDPEKTANHRDFIIARLSEDNEATFKQLIVEDGKKMLRALNPDWKPRLQEMTKDSSICGVVIGKVERW